MNEEAFRSSRKSVKNFDFDQIMPGVSAIRIAPSEGAMMSMPPKMGRPSMGPQHGMGRRRAVHGSFSELEHGTGMFDKVMSDSAKRAQVT